MLDCCETEYSSYNAEIIYNSAEVGGGIYCTGTIALKCRARVNYNSSNDTAENAYLTNDAIINVQTDLYSEYDSADFGVSRQSVGTFTSGFNSTNTIKPGAYFFTDNYDYIVDIDEHGEVMFVEEYWSKIQEAINAAEQSESKTGSFKLTRNATSVYDQNIEIPADVTFELDLNGYTLDRNIGEFYGQVTSSTVIENKGTLTIKDSSGDNSGVIKGSGSHESYQTTQGAIINLGTLTLEGGTITENCASCGAVYNEGVFNLFGGVITGNRSNANDSAGVFNSGTVNIKGAPKVYGNITEGSSNGVYGSQGISSGSINVVGSLKTETDSANIYVNTSGTKTFTSGYSKFNSQDPNEFFKLEDQLSANYEIKWNKAHTEAIAISTRGYDAYKITGAKLQLDDRVGIKFYFNLPEGDTVYMECEWGSEGAKNTKEMTPSNEDTDYSWSDSNLLSIAPKEVGDDIAIRIYEARELTYNSETDCDEYGELLYETVYNVNSNYIQEIIADGTKEDSEQEYTAAQRQMAAAVANYCAASQTYFNYNADNLVNAGLSYTPSSGVELISGLTGVTSELPADYKDSEGNVKISYYGTSMILRDKVVMRHYFWVDDIDTPLWGCIDKDGIGSERYTLIQFEENSHYFYLDSVGISPQSFLGDYTVTVKSKDQVYYYWSDKNQTYMNYTYNPVDYIYLACTRGDEKTKAAAEALYYYAQEAKIYTGAN